MSWFAKLASAAVVASLFAADAVRAIDAVRAASAAADSMAEWVVAVRPPKMISPTNSTKAGTPTAASTAAEPRSSLTRRQAIMVP